MKRFFAALAFASLCIFIHAQVLSNYGFVSASGTYDPISGGILLGNESSADQRFLDPSVPLGGTSTTGPGFPIGFNFYFNGREYDRVGISNEGWISLGQSWQPTSVIMTSSSYSSPLGSTSTINPYWQVSRIAGMATNMSAQTGSSLRIDTIGSLPYRVFVVQWTNYKKSSNGTGDSFSFQIRLEETTNKVQFVYGTMACNATSTTAQIGIRSDPASPASNFANRTTTTDWSATSAGTAATSSCTLSSSVYPSIGTSFTWTPPAPLNSIYSIGSGGNFANLAEAISFLNTNYPLQGIPEGGTVFNVAAGEVFTHTELLPAITATGASNRPITFRKSGTGANPLLQVQGTTSTSDAAIRLNGGDWFVFERIDIANYPSLSSLEYGYHLAAQNYDSCENNVISYCGITLNRSNTSSRAVFSAGTSNAGNNNNLFSYLNIANSATGVNLTGNSTVAYHNSSEQVLNCVMTDISAFGVTIGYSLNVRISQNQIGMCAGNSVEFIGVRADHSTSTGEVDNNTIIGNTTSATVYGCYAVNGTFSWHGNTIRDFACTGSSNRYGIYINNLDHQVYDNRIHSFNSQGNVHGISFTTNADDVSVYNNEIHNLKYTGPSGSGYLAIGIMVNGVNITIANNMIYDLGSTGDLAPMVRGISTGSGTGASYKIYHNTVFLKSGGTNTNYGSAALHLGSSTPTIDIRNNIFIDLSTPGTATSGKACAIWKSYSGFTNIAATSDRNIYYAGTPGPKNLICFDNTVPYENITDYKNATLSFDLGSFTENVPFISTLEPYNVHIPIGAATVAESNALPLPGWDFDIDGEDRDDNHPDIGADEGSFGVPAVVPDAANLISPADLSIVQPPSVTLNWTPAVTGGAPTGYLLYFGTDNPPSNLADGVDLGNVTSYDPNPDLNFLSTYFWKIVPYNATGSADPVLCPVWRFETHAAPLTGTYTIGSMGFYPSFSLAITHLNAAGVGAGGVTFLAAAAEVFAENPPTITATGSAANPVLFTSSDPLAANPLITPTGGTGTYGIRIAGGDYITFDRINIANLSSAANLNYGYGVLNSSANPANYVTIQNCAITLNRSTSGTNAIYVSGPGASTGISLISNLLDNAKNGIYHYPENSSSGLVISGNTISNVTTNGIYSRNSSGGHIYGNLISFASNATEALNGIYALNMTAGEIWNNTISGGSTNSTCYGLTQTGGSVVWHHNTVSNLQSSGIMEGFNCSSGTITLRDNHFHSLSSNVTVYGAELNLDSGGSYTVYNNRIHNLSTTTSSAYYAIGLYLGINSGNSVYNNMIWDLRNPGGSTAPQVRAIQVVNSTANLYYNTIYLDAVGNNANFSTAALNVTGGTSTRFNNNIFMNVSTPGSSGFTTGLWKSVDGFANINTASDNNIWYAGPPSAQNLICRTPSISYQSIDDFKAGVVSFDQNSLTEAVPLADMTGPDYDVHIAPGSATIAESNGLPVAGIDLDIDGDSRNASTPDIGADEGDFTVPLNVPAPAVNVSPVNGDYAVALQPNLVWYASGAGGAPTGYRIWMGSDNPPTDIVNGLDIGNVLSFTSPVTLNYLSSYYWKLVPYNDNGSADADACPIWQFSTHQAPLSGNWVIGSTGFYPSFTHAIKYLNASGVGAGGVTFRALAGETFAENPPPIFASGTALSPIVFTSSDTLATNPKITPSGGAGTFGIKISGGDFINFDHIDIANQTGQTSLVYGFWLEAQTNNGCTDNVIQNCVITLNRTTDGAGIRSDSASGRVNHRNKFLRNTITNAKSGIYLYDTSAALGIRVWENQISSVSAYGIFARSISGIDIAYNQIGMATSNTGTFYGIYCYNESVLGYIHHNTISGGSSTGSVYGIYHQYDKFNIYSNVVSNISSSSHIYGIRNYYGGSNGLVYSNTVSGLQSSGNSEVTGISVSSVIVYQNTVSGLSSSGLVRGIALSTGTAYRNMVTDLQTNSTANYVAGIYTNGTVTAHNNMISGIRAPSSTTVPQVRGFFAYAGTLNLYYNSVLLTSSGTASHSSAAVYANDPGTLNFQNNIFSNLSTPGASGKAVAFWTSQNSLNAVSAASNNNIWYAGIPSAQNLICYFGTTACQTLEAYKAANPGKDQNSYTEDAPFISKVAPFDLHLDSVTETYVEGNALVLGTIGFDFDGQTRDALRPDIGADEGNFMEVQLPPALPVYLSPADGAIDLALNTVLRWAAGPGGGNPDYYTLYFGETTPPPLAATNITGTFYSPSLLPDRTYYWKVDATNELGTATGVQIWSFDTRADDTIMEYPFVESFEDGNVNGSTSIYRWTQALGSGSYYWTANTNTNYNRAPRTGSMNITLRDGGDAWIFRPIYLTAGQQYELELWARQYTSSGAQAYLQVRYGPTASVAGMNQTIINIQEFINGSYQRGSGVFTPPSTGIWYLGIHGVCSNNINYLSLDDIGVSHYVPQPSFSINPPAWNFGMVNVSQTGDPKTFVISNPGDADLVIQPGDIYLDGLHSDDFVLTDPDGEVVIAGGASYNVYISFAPLETGLRTASLMIIDNTGSRATHQIPLSGRGIGPLVPPCGEDFEDGWIDWVSVNGTETSKWELGTASPYRNSYSAYISTNSGATNSYNPNSGACSHFYHDVNFPVDMTGMKLRFQFKGIGEAGYDYLSVHITDTSFTPTAGSIFSDGQIGLAYHSTPDWQLIEIPLDQTLAGQIKRLIFSWRNDSGGGTQPPAAIDNIRIFSTWPYLNESLYPENLQITSAGGNAIMTWTKVNGANDYIIEEADLPVGPFTPIGRGYNSFSVPGSHPRRFFRVRATD